MKRLPVVILVMLVVLVAVVTGCSRAPHYDSRLVAADSLMRTLPDSTLALVEAVSPDSLSSEGDRAYRDLLLTQARYRCYIVATSDSAINRALNYYSNHSNEREKLTRAYIYKGAVMEELDHPDSAMFYYKYAEATADLKDYSNLGQINVRIASLYRRHYGDMQICYDKYEQALRCYQLTDNKLMQFECLYCMSGCSGITGGDNSEELLNQASQIALELNDSLGFFLCQELMSRQLSQNSTSINRAKHIALNCLHHYRRFVNNDLLLDLSYIYAQNIILDSARYYLNCVNESLSIDHIGQIQARKCLILSKITSLEGQITLSSQYAAKAHQIEDSISNNKQKYSIQRIENAGNKYQTSKELHRITRLQFFLWIVSLMTLIAIVLGGLYYYNRRRYYRSIIKEMELMSNNVDIHQNLLEEIDEKDGLIDQFVISLVEFMQTSIDASENDPPAVIRKRIQQSVGKMASGDELWEALHKHLDKRHNGIISAIAQNSKITKKDLRFIELSCCGFNYIEISIVMGYAPKYISEKRKEIAKKLELDIPLLEYLNLMMKKD